MKNKKAICIIGGMGPQASVYMYKLLIDLSARDFNAKNGEDYPEIIIYSIPAPDFISDKDKKEVVLDMLKKRVKGINTLSISHIGIACNTAHLLLKDLQSVSKAPFVSMIDSVVNEIDSGIKKVGLLALPLTIKSSIYEDKLEANGIQTILPTNSQLKILDKIIRNVTEGKITKKDQGTLLLIANSLKKKGAQGIILGCTELPLVFPQKYPFLPVYNPVGILAMVLLRKYYAQTE